MKGNLQAIREAVERLVKHYCTGCQNDTKDGCGLEAGNPMCREFRKVRAALAAPARNCDVYTHDEALEVWAAEKEGPNNGCFDEWLYHNATEGGMK